MQDCGISSALALEIPQAYINSLAPGRFVWIKF